AQAEDMPPETRLIEAIFSGTRKQRKVHSNGVHRIERLCGADLFGVVCGDRNFGNVLSQLLREESEAFARKLAFNSFDQMIEHRIELTTRRLLDTYEAGYKGLRLWTGHQWNWSAHLALNSGVA